jgi:CheY-like chemotaxis protein
MPGIDGFETTRRIKAFRPELKIIAQTAFAMKEDKKLTMEANCDDYISKPIRLNDFIKMLVKHLNGQPPKS